MKNKWFFSAFMVALAILSISMEQVTVPNQEIIIQFSDTAAKPDQTQATIALVKSKLEALHIDNVKIEEAINGTLKITYYSDIEVSEIKNSIASTLESELAHTSYSPNSKDDQLPFEREPEYYQLDVYKIQDSNDLTTTTGDVVELKPETTRSSSIDTYATFQKLRVLQKNTSEKLAYRTYKNSAIAIDQASHKIPEVRAGPNAC